MGEFLASDGSDNAVLAAALSQEPHWWFGPVQLPVVDLERLAGPERDALCDVDPDEWHEDVGAMQESIDDGWEPPPLLAEWQAAACCCRTATTATRRSFARATSHAWTLVYFPSLDERDRFAARYLEELRVSGRRP